MSPAASAWEPPPPRWALATRLAAWLPVTAWRKLHARRATGDERAALHLYAGMALEREELASARQQATGAEPPAEHDFMPAALARIHARRADYDLPVPRAVLKHAVERLPRLHTVLLQERTEAQLRWYRERNLIPCPTSTRAPPALPGSFP